MEKPWIEGSRELLKHAVEHMSNASDFDRRIAFISIDNSIELSIKTYLSLPKRIRKKIGPSRKELQDAENSFPTYLDLIEKYDLDKLSSISLDDVEWYHRLRNQLYHNGNGLTVDKSKVEAYFEIAKTLYESLFNEILPEQQNVSYTTALGLFMAKWSSFEKEFRAKLPPKDGQLAYYWKRDFLKNIDKNLVPTFDEIMRFRNEVVHGNETPTVDEFNNIILKINFIKQKIDQT
jgi:hypothetical protein